MLVWALSGDLWFGPRELLTNVPVPEPGTLLLGAIAAAIGFGTCWCLRSASRNQALPT
ncbi:MAG: PEP-CTERM sorting domain-containing protein [Planctomycetota bacterium]|nr:MAG: PEP-CTERM sorting domain-containing protein [Planctomycetota bacterium]